MTRYAQSEHARRPASRLIRALAHALVLFVLPATALLSAFDMQSPDRGFRNPQRGRVNRHPRQRVCQGVSPHSCPSQIGASRSLHSAATPPVPVYLLSEPTLVPITQVQPASSSDVDSSYFTHAGLPRPPPFHS